MITVAHVAAPAAFGGLERVLADLSRALVGRATRVVVIAVLDEDAEIPAWLASTKADGVVVEVLRIPPRGYRTERRLLREALARHAVQVVHTHGYRADVIDGPVARGLGLGLVSTAHGFASTGWRGKFYEWLQVREWKRADAVVAVSEVLADVLAARGIPRTRLHVIRNGLAAHEVPLASREEARAHLGLPLEAELVGWVGRVSEEKGPDLAIASWAALRHPTATLCVIGDGPALAVCRAQAQGLGLGSRVRFLGAVGDAGHFLSAFDTLMLSSRTEGTPMVLLEAARAGVPIVATAVGGVPALLGEDGGRLVPSGSPTALAGAVDEVLSDLAEGRARARRLWDAIRARDAREDWVGKYRALYASVAR